MPNQSNISKHTERFIATPNTSILVGKKISGLATNNIKGIDYMKDCDLTDLELDNTDMGDFYYGKHFINCTFNHGSRYKELNLKGINIKGHVNFGAFQCDLEDSHITVSHSKSVLVLPNCNLTNSTIICEEIPGNIGKKRANLNIRAPGADFSSSTLDVVVSNGNLEYTDFSNAKLRRSVFHSTVLDAANFYNIQDERLQLIQCSLSAALVPKEYADAYDMRDRRGSFSPFDGSLVLDPEKMQMAQELIKNKGHENAINMLANQYFNK